MIFHLLMATIAKTRLGQIRSPIWVQEPMRLAHLLLLPHVHYQGAVLEVGQLSLELVPIWFACVTGSNLTCYDTTPAPTLVYNNNEDRKSVLFIVSHDSVL